LACPHLSQKPLNGALTGVLTSLRFCSAVSEDDERNRDISTTIRRKTQIQFIV
jgi:hypothetical protein